MKKMLNLFFLFGLLLNLSAQNAENGKISLEFDGIKMKVLVNYVRLQKGDGIIITASGESYGKNKSLKIMLQFSVNQLKPQNAEANSFMLNIAYKTPGMNQLHFSSRGNSGRYSNIGKQFTFTKVKTNCSVTKVQYQNGKIKITGKFNGIFSAETGIKATSGNAKIRNGKFEINF